MGKAHTLFTRILNLNTKRKFMVAFLLGVCAALALPPFFVLPLAFVAFVGFFWMIQASSAWKETFLIGWGFGFGHFLPGLYWISNSLLVEPELYSWLIPFAVMLIPAVLAFFIAAVAVITSLFPVRETSRIVLFAAVWTLAEMLRGWLFTGFPWNLIGYVWTLSDETMQPAAWIGTYGLGFITVIIMTLPALCLNIYREGAKVECYFSTGGIRYVWLSSVLLIALYGYGYGRLALADRENSSKDRAFVRVVQPNIRQELKWNAGEAFNNFMEHIRLTLPPAEGKSIAYVIWPEAAFSFLLEEEPELSAMIARALPEGSMLVTGGMRREGDAFNYRVWNSVQVLDKQGVIRGNYDKVTLVPFGEYVPLRRWLPFIEKITFGAKDFSRGEGLKTLSFKGFPSFSPLICYEVIFPGRVVAQGARPDFLLNVTNDGWFGRSTGPYQHFHMARMRAVEEGLPLVRAANTGISVVTDAYGRVIKRLSLGKKNMMDVALPGRIEPTLYSQYGNQLALVFVILITISSYRRAKRSVL